MQVPTRPACKKLSQADYCIKSSVQGHAGGDRAAQAAGLTSWFLPSLSRRLFGDFCPPLWRHPCSAGSRTLSAHRCRSRVLPIVHGIRRLAGHNVHHELAKLDGIAGPGGALHCHGLIWHVARADTRLEG